MDLTFGQKAMELGRQVADDDAKSLFRADYLNAEQGGKRTGHEVFYRTRVADCLVHDAQILLDLGRLYGILGEDAARDLLAFGCLINLARNVLLGLSSLAEVAEIEERDLLGCLVCLDTARQGSEAATG